MTFKFVRTLLTAVVFLAAFSAHANPSDIYKKAISTFGITDESSKPGEDDFYLPEEDLKYLESNTDSIVFMTAFSRLEIETRRQVHSDQSMVHASLILRLIEFLKKTGSSVILLNGLEDDAYRVPIQDLTFSLRNNIENTPREESVANELLAVLKDLEEELTKRKEPLRPFGGIKVPEPPKDNKSAQEEFEEWVKENNEVDEEFNDKNQLVPVKRKMTKEDFIQELSDQYSMDLEKANKVREYLEKTVIGQPELIEYYYDLALKRTVFGLGRKLPTVAYKMGQPGNGKDTSAEAFVDALFGEEGAHARVEDGTEMMFRMPVITEDKDIWGVLGSATGYVGSGDIPPFLRWLVKFSGGRYSIVEGKGMMEDPYIIENPEWKPGMVLEGYYPPEMAVLYVNEFHNWSKKAKDLIVKQALEKGYFQVNNPGQGVSALYIPVHFDIATNEGIGLVTSRDIDGTPHGDPKTYEETLKSYDVYAPDKRRLREEVLRTNELDKGGRTDSSREFLRKH